MIVISPWIEFIITNKFDIILFITKAYCQIEIVVGIKNVQVMTMTKIHFNSKKKITLNVIRETNNEVFVSRMHKYSSKLNVLNIQR